MKIKITAKYKDVEIIVNSIDIFEDGTWSVDKATTIEGYNFCPDNEHISDLKIEITNITK